MYLFFSRALYFRTATVLGILLFGAVGKGYGQRVYADEQQPSATFLLASVTNPGWAVDQDYSNNSTLNVTLGLLGSLGTAEQNLQFTGLNKPLPTSPITVKFTAEGNISSVLNLLGLVSFTTTLNNYTVGTPYSGQALLDLLGLFSSGQVVEATFLGPGTSYDGIKMKLSTVVGVGPSAKYFYAFFIVAPTVIDQVICQDDPAILTITNPQPNYTYKWYNVATGGSALQDGSDINYTTDPLTSTGQHLYYVEAIDHDTPGKSYLSARVPITVTVHPKPGTPEIEAQ